MHDLRETLFCRSACDTIRYDRFSSCRLIYSSAIDLLAAMKSSLNKCVNLNSNQTLLGIFRVFKKMFSQYTSQLLSRLPKYDSNWFSSSVVLVDRKLIVVGFADWWITIWMIEYLVLFSRFIMTCFDVLLSDLPRLSLLLSLQMCIAQSVQCLGHPTM